MPDSWRFEKLEHENERLVAEINRLKTQMQVFVDERNQLIGMGNAARWGVKILFALGGYGTIRFFHDIIHWLNAPVTGGVEMADSGVNGEKVIEAVKEIMGVIAKRDLPLLVDARLAEMDEKIARIAERVAVRAAKA